MSTGAKTPDVRTSQFFDCILCMWVAIKRLTEKQTRRMRKRLLPKDPYGLVAFAESAFDGSGEEARGSRHFTARQYRGCDVHDGCVFRDSGAGQSEEAASYLQEAKKLRDRSVKQLRQRITRTIR